MKRRTDYLNSRIKDIVGELMEDSAIDEMNVHEKAMETPGIKAKWVQIYYEESGFLKRIEDKLETTKAEYMKKYGETSDEPAFMVDRKISENKDIKKLERAISDQKEIVKYVYEINKSVWQGFSYDVKNIIDLLKLESM